MFTYTSAEHFSSQRIEKSKQLYESERRTGSQRVHQTLSPFNQLSEQKAGNKPSRENANAMLSAVSHKAVLDASLETPFPTRYSDNE